MPKFGISRITMAQIISCETLSISINENFGLIYFFFQERIFDCFLLNQIHTPIQNGLKMLFQSKIEFRVGNWICFCNIDHHIYITVLFEFEVSDRPKSIKSPYASWAQISLICSMLADRIFTIQCLEFHQRFAATRRAGFSALNFIRRTELSATTKLSAKSETPPFG